jgi:hypothetical protein
MSLQTMTTRGLSSLGGFQAGSLGVWLGRAYSVIGM